MKSPLFPFLLALLLGALPSLFPADLETAAAPGLPSLSLAVLPSGGEIWFDRSFLGRDEQLLTEVPPGSYPVEFRKEGYRTESLWLTLEEGTAYTLSAELLPQSAVLDLSLLPEDARVYRENRELDKTRREVPAGVWELKILRFGYQPVRLRLNLAAGEVREIRPDFLPVDPEILEFRLPGRSLNPGSLTGTGVLEGRFRISAPSAGRLEVADLSGTLLWTRLWPLIESETTEFSYDGTDNTGVFLPEGEYRIRFILFDPADGETDRRETSFRMDSRGDDRPRSLWSGSSGLLLAPRAAVLSRGVRQIGFSGFYRPGPAAGEEAVMSFHSGFRTSPAEGLEAAVTASFTAGGEETGRFSQGGMSARYRIAGRGDRGPGLAVQLRGTLRTDSTADPFTDFSGAALTLPAEWNLPLRQGTLRFLAAPEIQFSGIRMEVPSADPPEKGWFSRLYGRAGILWDSRRLSAGVSAAFRSSPFLENRSFLPTALELPVETAGEIRWLFPEASLEAALSVFLSFDGDTGPAPGAGLSLTLF